MKRSKRQSIEIMVLSTIVVVASSLPGITYAQDQSPWSAKAYGVLGTANESFGINGPTGGRVEADGDGIFGIGAAVDYRLNDRVSFEAGVAYNVTSDVDIDTVSGSADLADGPDFVPVHFGVNFHVYSGEKLAVHLGPRFAYVSFSDFDANVDGQRVEYTADAKSNDFALGLTVGVSYQVGNSPVSLLAEVSYYTLEMEVKEVGTSNTEVLDFDPISTQLGIQYQF